MFSRRKSNIVDSDDFDLSDEVFPDPNPDDIRRHAALKNHPAFRAALDNFDRTTDALLERFHRDRADARSHLFDALLRDLSSD